MISNSSVNHAIRYILNHLDEDITVDEVARHCNFSKYYFSRLFKSATGESVYQFIKRIKIEHSALQLKILQEKSITAIGADFGYSASNYSTVFKRLHHMSPAEFRQGIKKHSMKHPTFHFANAQLEDFLTCDAKISVSCLPDYPVIYERYIGNYGDLSTNWGGFLDRYRDYITDSTLLMELTFHDPSITNQNECLYEICLSTDGCCTLENTELLKGGRFAVYHFEGSVEEIYFAYQSIFLVWLPQSRYMIDHRYGFNIYRSVDCSTLYMKIDICIPIQ